MQDNAFTALDDVSLEVESYYEELWARYVSPTTRRIAPPIRAAARAR
jgi:hypothetical protein